jgi:hypothetical protein
MWHSLSGCRVESSGLLVPLILETPVDADRMEAEIAKVRKALPSSPGIMVA